MNGDMHLSVSTPRSRKGMKFVSLGMCYGILWIRQSDEKSLGVVYSTSWTKLNSSWNIDPNVFSKKQWQVHSLLCRTRFAKSLFVDRRRYPQIAHLSLSYAFSLLFTVNPRKDKPNSLFCNDCSISHH